jgi:hypothetical protein
VPGVRVAIDRLLVHVGFLEPRLALVELRETAVEFDHLVLRVGLASLVGVEHDRPEEPQEFGRWGRRSAETSRRSIPWSGWGA